MIAAPVQAHLWHRVIGVPAMSILDIPAAPPPAASQTPAASVDEIGLPVGAATPHVPDLPAQAAPSAAVPTLALPAVEAALVVAPTSGSVEIFTEKLRGRPCETGQS